MCYAVIVDDELEIGEELVEAFELLGCEALFFSDAQECLVFLKDAEVCVNIVVADLMMPAMFGTEFLRLARQLLGKDARLVLMTGLPDLTDETGKFASDIALLKKPIGFRELKAFLRKIFRSEEARTQGRP